MIIVKPIECKYCHKEVKFLPIQINITEYHTPCTECGANLNETNYFEFCSYSCARKFLTLHEKHICNEHYIYRGITCRKKKSTEVQVYCEVCRKNRWLPLYKARAFGVNGIQ